MERYAIPHWGGSHRKWRRSESGIVIPGAPGLYKPAGGVSFRNLIVSAAQEELIKRWRFLSGSSRQIQQIAVGSGYTLPTVSDSALTTPLAAKDIDPWDDALITPDSTGLSVVVAKVTWLDTEANGTHAEVALTFDNGDLCTHALFSKDSQPNFPLTVTGATQANPVVITTSASHGLSTGDEVHIDSVGGMTQINNRNFTVTVVDADEFSLDGEDGTGHSAFTSGGDVFAIIVKSSAEVVITSYTLNFTS